MGLMVAGLILIPLVCVACTVWLLNRNYRAARAIGVPIVICPYDPENWVHSLICVPMRPIYQFLLPSSIFTTVELSIWGWEFRDKAAIHEKLGPTFILVTTGTNRLVSAAPMLAQNILTRRMAFLHPEITTQAMGFLGPNIVTAQGDSWSRQRRIIAPALNDRISPAVWKESAQQASCLVTLLVDTSASWSKSAQTITGLRTVAINVLAHIAYGHHKHFALPSPNRTLPRDFSYVDAISFCTEQLILAAFLPARLMRLPIMPQLLQTLGLALIRLPDLTRDMLQQARQNFGSAGNENKTSNANNYPETIVNTLVRFSDKEQVRNNPEAPTLLEKNASTDSTGCSNSYLTEDEIAGNLFIFTAAGFDTTANTMGYAVTLLAAYPEWQTWVQDEIDSVLGGPVERQRRELQLPDYATGFPKLVRCMAVMLETLRLFPPVTLLMRGNRTDQSIPLGNLSADSSCLLAPSAVYVNVMALHTSKSIWGADALDFKPARWIQPISEENPTEILIQPRRGTYIPWSTGPRSCPGQKMSQVEFVAVIATLFSKCVAEPMARNGESMQQARQRLLDATQDSQPVLTLQMNKPMDVHIKWTER